MFAPFSVERFCADCRFCLKIYRQFCTVLDKKNLKIEKFTFFFCQNKFVLNFDKHFFDRHGINPDDIFSLFF